MAKHDLTNALEKSFTFSIDEKEYEFNKPTVREMRSVSKKFAAAESEANSADKEALAQEALDEFYKFVKPTNNDTPIGELLENQPMSVQIAFNEMVQKELGA